MFDPLRLLQGLFGGGADRPPLAPYGAEEISWTLVPVLPGDVASLQFEHPGAQHPGAFLGCLHGHPQAEYLRRQFLEDLYDCQARRPGYEVFVVPHF